jgi:hypothetical protein
MFKLILPILLMFFSTFSLTFNKEEIMSLTKQERLELFQKISTDDRKILADSLVVWGTQQAVDATTRKLQDNLKHFQDLKEIVERSQIVMDKLASQVGFSMIMMFFMAASSLSLGILMYRKQNKKLFKAFCITISTLTVLYAFVMFLVY